MTIVTATRLRTDNEDIEDSFCLLRTSNQEIHHRVVLNNIAIKVLEKLFRCWGSISTKSRMVQAIGENCVFSMTLLEAKTEHCRSRVKRILTQNFYLRHKMPRLKYCMLDTNWLSQNL